MPIHSFMMVIKSRRDVNSCKMRFGTKPKGFCWSGGFTIGPWSRKSSQVSVFEAAVKHGNKFAYLQSCSTNKVVVILVLEVQVLEDEKVVVVASSGSCVSVESIEILSSLNIPWVILNLFESSALLNESNESQESIGSETDGGCN
ncbi:uncharacterized protein LOC113321607 isoform X2 [Papaver somniferum]|uniref:uncharacterized protein LOC113321607 isoform X2 n=1 Tax=Papaver somniferum TaxID=3469 RepID=UPI000E6FE3DC|nr:uncharacterized protein LOC113321607 isoform X2 [Papaver somniferum]